jgi:hypothetical protein
MTFLGGLSLFDIAEYMLDYIAENNLSDEYLMRINFPQNIILGLPLKDSNGFELIIPLYDYLDEIISQMNMFIWDELYYKENWKKIEDIKLSFLLKKFELPICPFWLNFCELVKTSFSEEVYT